VALRPAAWWVAAVLTLAAIVAAVVSLRRPTPDEAIASLLVMPFTPIDARPGSEYLEGGLADALITRLGSIGVLRVPPTAAYRTGDDPFAAATRLKVDAVLTGTLQRSGDRLRLTAQLSRVSDRRQMWASSFDEPFTDIFSVQDQIADRVASTLVTAVTGEQRAALRRRETTDAAAYDLYLRGRQRWKIRTPDSIRQAIEDYKHAIALDQRFALAYAGLADAYAITASGLAPDVRFPLARQAAERALALDDRLAEAHTALGFLSYKSQWDWTRADREFRRAIEIDPGYALAHHWYGEMLGLLTRFDQSAAQFEQARALDPYSPTVRADYAVMLVNAGRFDDARRVVEEGLRTNSSEWRMYWAMTKLLVAEGHADEAMASDATYRELSGSDPREVAQLRAAAAAGGRRAVVRQLINHDLARLAGSKRPPYGLPTSLAAEYAELEDRPQTIKWLTVAVDRKEDAALMMRATRIYRFLDGTPEYEALLRRVGFQLPGASIK
jgi:TolB-like protein/Tfp pilus assembly protein PilF